METTVKTLAFGALAVLLIAAAVHAQLVPPPPPTAAQSGQLMPDAQLAPAAPVAAPVRVSAKRKEDQERFMVLRSIRERLFPVETEETMLRENGALK